MKAFPTAPDNGHEEDGMDLRDYFAAKAMPMIFEFVEKEITGDGSSFQIEDFVREKNISSEMAVVAEYCYILADAMMEARKNDS